MKEASVKCVIKDPLTSRYVLILETKDGFYIPIKIGVFEAEAIYTELNQIVPPRPMTYDFITGILSAIDDVKVEKVIIEDYEDGIFKASLYLVNGSSCKVIDCRPSDAIALSLRVKSPVYIEEVVLSKCKCFTKDCIKGETGADILEEILTDQGTTYWDV
ncbi:bifunctional nuclease family protein [Deferribacter autotrophicus]|uniref:Bifunctional nuclease family protein n=1 Tax=Deferribacter autotrophicus TaxID=500465 RepID=A0A5A8F3Q9_9BACT|nr:bifunctional nuclease family protein [Deferribacter autotrophicus]KAA0258101.1 bifunctional nuclease family protein [Deferribacter autotrophicus]